MTVKLEPTGSGFFCSLRVRTGDDIYGFREHLPDSCAPIPDKVEKYRSVYLQIGGKYPIIIPDCQFLLNPERAFPWKTVIYCFDL